MDLTFDRPLLLRGKIVQPDGTGLDRYVSQVRRRSLSTKLFQTLRVTRRD